MHQGGAAPLSPAVSDPARFADQQFPADTPRSAAAVRRVAEELLIRERLLGPCSGDADDVATLLRGEGASVSLLPGDLEDQAENERGVAEAVAAMGGLDLLVMVGGVMPTVASIDDFDTAQLDRVLRTNVHSLFWLTKAASPHLAAGSAIITTSSIQAFDPSPDLVEYAVSKAGIANWTRAMAQQLAPRGIRVNGVAPGPFWNPLQPAGVPTEKIETFGSEATYGRPGQPVELGSTYVYLAEQAVSCTSGETIVVSGGTAVH